jgi:hypothetical protein
LNVYQHVHIVLKGMRRRSSVVGNLFLVYPFLNSSVKRE